MLSNNTKITMLMETATLAPTPKPNHRRNTGASAGLGKLLRNVTNGFHMGGAFGVLILLGLMATLLNVVVSLFERKMVWSHETYQTNS